MIWDSAPKGTLMMPARCAWKLLNFILLFLAMAMLYFFSPWQCSSKLDIAHLA